MASKTLYDKLWDSHLVKQREDGTALIYIDRQLVHEVTSPQAFEGLRLANRERWRVDANLATPDHNVPTTARLDAAGNRIPILDPQSAAQLRCAPLASGFCGLGPSSDPSDKMCKHWPYPANVFLLSFAYTSINHIAQYYVLHTVSFCRHWTPSRPRVAARHGTPPSSSMRGKLVEKIC